MSHETGELEGDLSEEAKVMLAAAQKIVHAGIGLIRNGYGQMGIIPYTASSGYWRCEFYPAGRPSKAFYCYSTGAEKNTSSSIVATPY